MSASLWVKMPPHHTPTVELSVDGIDTTRQQHAAQDGLFGGHGIEQLAVDLAILKRIAQPLGVGGVGEGIRHGLVEARGS